MKLKDAHSKTYSNIFKKCKIFEDIYDIAEDMSKKEKGDLMEVISYYILKLSPELNIGLQEIWLYDDVPTKLLKELNLPSKDKGIDLIVKIDNEYHAVQSKFRQNKDTIIKWNEISTFYGLSFGIGERIKGGFFITNTVDMCPEVNNGKKVRVINGNFFMDKLPEKFFENICLNIAGKTQLEYIKKEPFSHQKQCIDVCVKYFSGAFADNDDDSVCSDTDDADADDVDDMSDVDMSDVDDSVCSNADDINDISDIDIDCCSEMSDLDIDIDCNYDNVYDLSDMDNYNFDKNIFNISHENENNNAYNLMRILIQLACGSGKTLISYWIDQMLNNNITLFLVPSLNLLSQFYSDIVNQSYAEKQKIRFLLIGSDMDTDDNDINIKGGGLNLYLDQKEIRQCINKNIKQKEKLIIICTYQSAPKLAAACKANDVDKQIQIDFGIFDEAHKTVGQAGKLFSLMLDDKNLVIKKRLFMTATTKMYQGKLNEDDGKDVLSMNNEKVYGKQIFTYSVDQAIKDKRLVDYDIISLVATNKEIEKLIKDNKLVSFQKEFTDEESNYLGTILMLLKKIHDGTAKHLLTYHNTVSRAKKFSEFMNKINDLLYKKTICIDTFSGKTSMAKRNRLIKDFTKSDVGILCTSRVLNEGVNIPIIDSVCFVDERQSTIDIVQCVGRMLRLYDGKTIAHVFIPTFIDSLEDEDIGKTNFANTIRILKSMKSVDGDIAEYFMLKSEGKHIVGRQIVRFEGLVTMKKSQQIELDKWSGTVETKVWKVVDSFEFKKNLLFEFVGEHKRVPTQKEKYKNVDVGVWLVNKKKNISKNDKLYTLLSANDIVKKSIDEYLFKKYNNKDKKYFTFCQQLKTLFQFVMINNRTPIQQEKYKNIKVGQWLVSKKKEIWSAKNDELYNILSTNKIIKKSIDKYLLNKERNKNKKKYSSNEKIKLFIDFVEINKKMPAEKDKYKDINVGKWIHSQRKKIKSKNDETYVLLSKNELIKNELDKYLAKKENNNDKKIQTFDETLKIFFEYVEKNKKIPTNKEKYKDSSVGRWINSQKSRIKSKDDEIYKKLSENKIVKNELDKYLINKENNKDKILRTFDETLKIFFEYVKENKKIPTGKEKYKNIKINSWLSDQKAKLKSKDDKIYKKLSKNEIVKIYLDTYLINKENNKNKKIRTFDETLKMFFEYVKENKKIPTGNEEYKNIKINSWFNDQKKKLKSKDDKIYKKLSENEIVKTSLDKYLLNKKKRQNNIAVKNKPTDDEVLVKIKKNVV